MATDIRVYDLKQGQFFSFERDGEKLIGVVLNNKERLILSPAPPRFPRRSIENYHASPYPGAKLTSHRAALDRLERPAKRKPENGEIAIILGRSYFYLAGEGGGASPSYIDIEKWENAAGAKATGLVISEIVPSWEVQDGAGAVICRFPE
jgi:hypothetical protein